MTQTLDISSGVPAPGVITDTIPGGHNYRSRCCFTSFAGPSSRSPVEKRLQLGRKWHWLFGINLLAIAILFLIRLMVEAALRNLGKSVETLRAIDRARLS